MTQAEYVDILLSGYIDNREYLDKHIYRECKEAEKRNVEYYEFFDRLLKAYELLEKERELKYFDQLDRLYFRPLEIYETMKAAGKDVNGILEQIKQQKPDKKDVWLNLTHFPGGKYTGMGHLHDGSFTHISNAIAEAWNKIKNEKSPTENRSTKEKQVPHNLLQAWTKGEAHYKKVIEYLKQEYSLTQAPFVAEDENGKLSWIGPNIQYLGAFLKRCKIEGYVRWKKITSIEWVDIFNNTFPDIKISPKNDKPFRPNATFGSMYLDPFENLPRP